MEGGETQGWCRCRGWSEGGDLKWGGGVGLCSEAARESGSNLGIVGDHGGDHSESSIKGNDSEVERNSEAESRSSQVQRAILSLGERGGATIYPGKKTRFLSSSRSPRL